MRRFILSLVSLLPALVSADYNVPFNPRGGELFVATEDCETSLDAIWTQWPWNVSDSWNINSGVCHAQLSAANQAAVIANDTDTNTTDNFCSMKVTQANAGGLFGCVFRADSVGGLGEHYFVYMGNVNDQFKIQNHQNPHSFDSEADKTDCSCTWSADINNGDYIGMHLTGTATNTAVSFHDMGASAPSDLHDPTTWPAATCTCSASELNTAGLKKVDGAGRCGLVGYANSTSDTVEPEIDDFACGDAP